MPRVKGLKNSKRLKEIGIVRDFVNSHLKNRDCETGDGDCSFNPMNGSCTTCGVKGVCALTIKQIRTVFSHEYGWGFQKTSEIVKTLVAYDEVGEVKSFDTSYSSERPEHYGKDIDADTLKKILNN